MASKDDFSIIPTSWFSCEAVSLRESNVMILIITQHSVYTDDQLVFVPVPSLFVIYAGSSRRLEEIKKSEG